MSVERSAIAMVKVAANDTPWGACSIRGRLRTVRALRLQLTARGEDGGRGERVVGELLAGQAEPRLDALSAANHGDSQLAVVATQLRGLLSSGHARVTRTKTDDGRAAIEIASVHPQSGPRTTYYVNPTDYAPIELDTYGDESPRDVTRVHFHAYEILPLAGHSDLLRFTAPASARIDRNPADYRHAASIPEPF